MDKVEQYTSEDIEKFINVTKSLSNDTQSRSMRKLLSVKDRISIFKNIEADELKVIIYDLKFIKYNLDDVIIKQNETSHQIFFIITGVCKVFSNAKKVGILNAGDVFGEAGAIFNIKRNATIVSNSNDVTLLSFCIDHNNMEFCSHSLATLYKNLAFQINTKLQELNYNYTIQGHI
ncbi:MAG: cyclic nucleotide-binding domain-containing protein [Campylobacterota bacterium]|nr:cyclic nucleotide-binding domain-containing protein [Campylobacterota bacterium]